LKDCFTCIYPDYDVQKLSVEICALRGWQLTEVRFYTGFPSVTDDAFWNKFWSKKLLAMSRAGVKVYSRKLRYRDKKVRLPNGAVHTVRTGEEKGIDVRIAVDVIRLAHRSLYDVAVVFSQDQDLSEVADEIRVIASEQNRWIKIASAYPDGPNARNSRGINGTDWVRFDQALYNNCIDPRDYRI
jgi:uncharacterized LabA/DUF88 family protein